MDLAAAGVELGRDYPLPVVDHAEAREKTLERYAVVKQAAGCAGRPAVGSRRQKLEPGCSRKAASSAVLARPRMALRCGKRPKRAITSR